MAGPSRSHVTAAKLAGPSHSHGTAAGPSHSHGTAAKLAGLSRSHDSPSGAADAGRVGGEVAEPGPASGVVPDGRGLAGVRGRGQRLVRPSPGRSGPAEGQPGGAPRGGFPRRSLLQTLQQFLREEIVGDGGRGGEGSEPLPATDVVDVGKQAALVLVRERRGLPGGGGGLPGGGGGQGPGRPRGIEGRDDGGSHDGARGGGGEGKQVIIRGVVGLHAGTV